jgi:hypothetical protein
VRRERHFVGTNLSNTIQPSNEFFGLYFDGKKNKARVIENKNGFYYPGIEIEGHYATRIKILGTRNCQSQYCPV